MESVPIVIQRRTLGTFVGQIIGAGLHIEALVETPLDSSLATEVNALIPHAGIPVPRARVMPTTFIIKARKPSSAAREPDKERNRA